MLFATLSRPMHIHALTSVRPLHADFHYQRASSPGKVKIAALPSRHLSAVLFIHHHPPILRANSLLAIPRLSLPQLHLPAFGCDTSLRTAASNLRYHVHFHSTSNLTHHRTHKAGSLISGLPIGSIAVNPGTHNIFNANTNIRHAKEGPRLDTGTGPTARQASQRQ